MARRVQLLSPHPPHEIALRLRACTRTPVPHAPDPGAEQARFVGVVEEHGFRLRLGGGEAGAISVRGACTVQASATRVDLLFTHARSPAGLLLAGCAMALLIKWPRLHAATDAWTVIDTLAVPAGILLLGAIVSSVFALRGQRALATALQERLEAAVAPPHAARAPTVR